MKKLIGIILLLSLFTGCVRYNVAEFKPFPIEKFSGKTIALRVNPSEGWEVIAISAAGGLFKSSDSGITWRNITGNTGFYFNDLVYSRINPKIIIAASGEGDMRVNKTPLWRSENGGETWSPATIDFPVNVNQNNFMVHCLVQSVVENRIWAGTNHGLAFSDDQGANWSFKPPVNGVRNKVFTVIPVSLMNIIILSDDEVQTSTDGGNSFAQSSKNGLPSGGAVIIDETKKFNSICVSPYDPNHVFYTFTYGRNGEGFHALYESLDGGQLWLPMLDNPEGRNAPFVEATKNPINPDPEVYALYYCDGLDSLMMKSINDVNHQMTRFQLLAHPHSDIWDLTFMNDGKSPYFLANDGGIASARFNQFFWECHFTPQFGYNALQISDMVGQFREGHSLYNLYFSTQDNNIYGSHDNGYTWTNERGGEGMYLNIETNNPNGEVSGVGCADCENFIADNSLENPHPFQNPMTTDSLVNGNAKLLEKHTYLMNRIDTNHNNRNVFYLTRDSGVTWEKDIYTIEGDRRELSQVVSMGEHKYVVYTAYKDNGSINGEEKVNLNYAVIDLNKPPREEVVLTGDVGGFGNIGRNWWCFGQYATYKVNPFNPNHLIVSDITSHKVKVTYNGGLLWHDDDGLTQLVTKNGELLFNTGQTTQISSISFDPDCARHILVGTRQAGLIESLDYGGSWAYVEGTDVISNITSCFFGTGDTVVIGSYGRGLWHYIAKPCKDEPDCSHSKLVRIPCIELKQPTVDITRPVIVEQFLIAPFEKIQLIPKDHTVYRFVFFNGGHISGVHVDPKSGKLLGISGEGYKTEVYTDDLKEMIDEEQAFGMFKMEVKNDGFDNLYLEQLLMNNKTEVKGLILKGQKVIAPILCNRNLSINDIPRKKVASHYIQLLSSKTPIDGTNRIRKLIVKTVGYDSKQNFRILFDGVDMSKNVIPKFSSNGIVYFTLQELCNFGTHTIEVSQSNANEQTSDVLSFYVKYGEHE